MSCLNLVKKLEGKLTYERLEIIIQELELLKVEYRRHQYSTGTNIIVDLGEQSPRIGIGSHFGIVPMTGGANR
jgi:hypothetical protein